MNINKIIKLINHRKSRFSEFLYSGLIKKDELNILVNTFNDLVINKHNNLNENSDYIYITIDKLKKS